MTWAQSFGMWGYVEGYRKAACALYDSAVETGMNANYLLFPLAFLWRHYLELALKEVILTGRQLRRAVEPYPAGHRLGDLWREARSHVAYLCGDDARELVNIEANIREFESIDPGADGFRYPVNVKGTASTLQNAPAFINIPDMHDAMRALSQYFDCVRMDQEARLDAMIEAHEYYR